MAAASSATMPAIGRSKTDQAAAVFAASRQATDLIRSGEHKVGEIRQWRSPPIRLLRRSDSEDFD
jgi:hypothetical protein